jgi:juvenile hormone diol kinase
VLSDFRRQKLASGFAELDVNGDGLVEDADVERLIRNHGEAYGCEPGSAEYEDLAQRTRGNWELLRTFDTDGDGCVSLDEWVAGFDAFLQQREAFLAGMDSLVDSFYAMADRDHDGRITEDELILHYRAWNHTEAQAREAFKRLDRAGRGGITKDEWMLNLEEYYFSEDPEAPGNWLAPHAGTAGTAGTATSASAVQ